ncbi:hypothetical protein BX600DRAFT_311062 [Xylariales sp. PMI_506]|nr:hypothetical protein BX600DRAFT_311062 [Xylariales sp. PMI_506]
MTAEVFQQARLDGLSAEDFETASIHSAAPSYISEAPSYHSTLPQNEAVPPYSPPESTQRTNTSTPRSMVPNSGRRGPGLPPLPDPVRRTQVPQLSQFRISTWSSLNSNPTARHYQAVAHRRVSAASTANAVQVQQALRTVMGRITEDDERERVRPLEDPYLVGEEAAARARRERLARENGDEVLIQEDRRWDWFLAQMKSWDARSQAWKEFEDSRRQRGRRFGSFGH